MIYKRMEFLTFYYFLIYFSGSERRVYFFRAVENSHSAKHMLFNNEDLNC